LFTGKSTLRNAADVAIIGGGIVGISAAYFLAQNKNLRTVIFEKDLLCQGSTGLSVGGIRQQFSHPANIHLSQHTLHFFEAFRQKHDVFLPFNKVGYLFLAQKKDTWASFEASVRTQRSLSVPVEILSPEDIRTRWPFLRVDDLQGGTFGPEDGYADPYQVTMAMAEVIRREGVNVFEKTKVTGISISKNKVSGLRTERGSLSVPNVINAAGPWAGEVCRMAGLDLPVCPYRRQVFVTKPFEAISKPIPLILDFDSLFYMRKEGPGILIGKSDPGEPSSFNTHVDRSFMEQVIEAACHRAPLLEEAEIAKGWGGLYTITPDGNAIIGRIPGVEGFYCAIGFSGHGFQHGPAAGRILSDLVMDGHTAFDLTPYSPDRFTGIPLDGEQRIV
jgi:sarcosine oxidase subunit beta